MSKSSSFNKLAAQIKQHCQNIVEGMRTSLEAAIAAGKALRQAKLQVQPGDWKKWVSENTDLSVRTAQQYMQLAKNEDVLALAKAQGISLSSIAKALNVVAKSKHAKAQANTTVDDAEDEGTTICMSRGPRLGAVDARTWTRSKRAATGQKAPLPARRAKKPTMNRGATTTAKIPTKSIAPSTRRTTTRIKTPPAAMATAMTTSRTRMIAMTSMKTTSIPKSVPKPTCTSG